MGDFGKAGYVPWFFYREELLHLYRGHDSKEVEAGSKGRPVFLLRCPPGALNPLVSACGGRYERLGILGKRGMYLGFSTMRSCFTYIVGMAPKG
ncbi:hypothetical protein Holit_01263 [Hollandina sp. SP2]